MNLAQEAWAEKMRQLNNSSKRDEQQWVRKRPPAVQRILEAAAASQSITLTMLMSDIRTRQATNARVVAARELRAMGFSYASIGRWLGVHHTTVVHYFHGRRIRVTMPVGGDLPYPDLSGEWAI